MTEQKLFSETNKKRRPQAFPVLGIICALALICGGCKVSLYSNLDESDATEIMALLMRHGIQCDKVPAEEGAFEILIARDDIVRGAEILKGAGFPRDKFQSFGDVFKKEGMISSPFEERIRYIHALSQELEETISKIDGVLVARVSVVIPDNDPLADTLRPSSASVFIKTHPLADTDIKSRQEHIRELVVNSIEGVAPENVSLVMFPGSRQGSIKPVEFRKVLGFAVAPRAVFPLSVLLYGMLGIVASLAGALVFGHRRLRKNGYPSIKDMIATPFVAAPSDSNDIDQEEIITA